MGLLRLILVAVLVLVVWRLARGWARRAFPRRAEPRRQVERMLRCAHCGLHVPETEAVRDGDGVFCSEAHRRAAGRS